MAFGDLIKSNTVDHQGPPATYDFDLGSNPASGNLLIIVAGTHVASTVILTEPVDFTLIHSHTAGNSSRYWWYKISDGDEQTIGIEWAAAVGSNATYMEYEWDGSTPTVTKGENTDNVSAATNSQPSGAATPTTTNNICLTCHFTSKSGDSDGGQAVDGSWIEDFVFTTFNSGGAKVSRLVDAATSSQEATHTDTDTGASMYGAIAIFDVAAAGATLGRGRKNTIQFKHMIGR